MRLKLKALLFILLMLCFSVLASSAVQVKTPAEEARYTKYTQNEDIAGFLSLLEVRSRELRIVIAGRTREVENYPAKDIFLAILTEEGVKLPKDLNRQKPTILYTASQHGNEQSAKEAALRLIRDMAVGDLKPLLKKINLLVIPQVNPYGNFFDIRQNEIGLDLNRDHVKLEGESTRAIHRVFQLYQPEVTMDVHEKGDDYYRVSVGCVSNLNIHQSLQDCSRQTIFSGIEKKLLKKGLTFHEYLVSEPLGVDTSSGARIFEEAAGREMMLRYSTTGLNDGRNSLGIYETLSFIQEGASRHDLQTLEARTNWQYQGLRALAEIVADNPAEIIKLVADLRSGLLKRAETKSESDPIHLKMEYVRDTNQPELVIRSFERSGSPIRGILKVDKKAGDYLMAEDITSYPGPTSLKVITRTEKNWFPLVESRLKVTRPAGYIIPGRRTDLAEVLVQHGIKVQMLIRDDVVDAVAYKVAEIIPAAADYMAPRKIEVDSEKLSLPVKKGDFYVSCLQPAANLIPCLLEPQSEYGLIRYFKFRLVPEPGNRYEIFRVDLVPALALVDYKNWSYQ